MLVLLVSDTREVIVNNVFLAVSEIKISPKEASRGSADTHTRTTQVLTPHSRETHKQVLMFSCEKGCYRLPVFGVRTKHLYRHM